MPAGPVTITEDHVGRTAVLVAALVVAYGAPAAVAHDGHGETIVVTGAVQAIDSDRIQVETRDRESFLLQRVWLTITDHTKYKRGKARVDAQDILLTKGDQIVAIAMREQAEDYSSRYLALQIEVSSARREQVDGNAAIGEEFSIVITDSAGLPALRLRIRQRQ